MVTQWDPRIRYRLTVSKALAYELHDLGTLRELTVVREITRLEFRQIENCHTRLF